MAASLLSGLRCESEGLVPGSMSMLGWHVRARGRRWGVPHARGTTGSRHGQSGCSTHPLGSIVDIICMHERSQSCPDVAEHPGVLFAPGSLLVGCQFCCFVVRFPRCTTWGLGCRRLPR